MWTRPTRASKSSSRPGRPSRRRPYRASKMPTTIRRDPWRRTKVRAGRRTLRPDVLRNSYRGSREGIPTARAKEPENEDGHEFDEKQATLLERRRAEEGRNRDPRRTPRRPPLQEVRIGVVGRTPARGAPALSRLVEVPAGVPRLRVGKPSPECADGLHLAETPRRRPIAAVTAIARAPPRDTRNAPRPSGAPPR